MKGWLFSLILLSLSSVFIKGILPKGEKAPLYSSLRFLIATMLVAVSFSPIVPLFGKEAKLTVPNSFSSDFEAMEGAEDLILRRFAERLNEVVLKEFPDVPFTLSVFTDENKIPEKIQIRCENKKAANEIAAYITEHFQIESSVY